MSQGYEEGLTIVLSLAEELRKEFGVGIDAHPGGLGIEAGDVNRAFRAGVKAIIAHCATGGDDPATALTHVLREVARRRLTDFGLRPDEAEVCISSEPKLGDQWFAYLGLAPKSVINDLIT